MLVLVLVDQLLFPVEFCSFGCGHLIAGSTAADFRSGAGLFPAVAAMVFLSLGILGVSVGSRAGSLQAVQHLMWACCPQVRGDSTICRCVELCYPGLFMRSFFCFGRGEGPVSPFRGPVCAFTSGVGLRVLLYVFRLRGLHRLLGLCWCSFAVVSVRLMSLIFRPWAGRCVLYLVHESSSPFPIWRALLIQA